MTLDERLYQLPLVGHAIKRMYAYFKQHTLFVDAIHVAMGLGFGLLVAGEHRGMLAGVMLAVAAVGHMYAWRKGKTLVS